MSYIGVSQEQSSTASNRSDNPFQSFAFKILLNCLRSYVEFSEGNAKKWKIDGSEPHDNWQTMQSDNVSLLTEPQGFTNNELSSTIPSIEVATMGTAIPC